jgi:PAS domain S-box-containing protein
VNLDIEERKCAEQALREGEHQLHQIIETVPALLWSLAPDGEPTHFNQRLLDYFGRPFEDFKHAGWGLFVHPDDLSETEQAFSHAVQTGTSFQAAYRLRRADGEFRWPATGHGDIPFRCRRQLRVNKGKAAVTKSSIFFGVLNRVIGHLRRKCCPARSP